MNGGVRVALGLLVILGGIVLVIYGIQGMWPFESGRGMPLAPPPPGGRGRPIGPQEE
jgi:hypothetical protein